jgi:hypothetical protein
MPDEARLPELWLVLVEPAAGETMACAMAALGSISIPAGMSRIGAGVVPNSNTRR